MQHQMDELGQEGHSNNGPNQVEHNMGASHTLSVQAGLYRCQYGGNTGTNVIAQQDGDGAFQGNQALAGHSHQNTDGSGGGLDHQGHAKTNGQAQQRMGGKAAQEVNHGLMLPQGSYCIPHHGHTQHQDTKPQEYGTQMFQLAFFAHGLHQETDGQNQGNIIS